MMGEDKVSPDGRWFITWRVVKDFHAYFESDVRYEVSVVHRATKKTLETYYRDVFENSEGTDHSGVVSVEFAGDDTVIATFEDQPDETLRLPTDAELLEAER